MRSCSAIPAAPLEGRLGRDFFNRPTLRVARELIGKYIVRSGPTGRIAAMIVETEAYKGPRDLAAHTAGGRRTARVMPLYADGGTAYVYLVYGLHWLLNFSTAGAGIPEGVLVRGVLADTGGKKAWLAGPGKVTCHLQIDKLQDGIDATQSSTLWLEDRGVRVPHVHIRHGPRIGVDYAGPYWAARPWRFRIDAATAERALDRAMRTAKSC